MKHYFNRGFYCRFHIFLSILRQCAILSSCRAASRVCVRCSRFVGSVCKVWTSSLPSSMVWSFITTVGLIWCRKLLLANWNTKRFLHSIPFVFSGGSWIFRTGGANPRILKKGCALFVCPGLPMVFIRRKHAQIVLLYFAGQSKMGDWLIGVWTLILIVHRKYTATVEMNLANVIC